MYAEHRSEHENDKGKSILTKLKIVMGLILALLIIASPFIQTAM